METRKVRVSRAKHMTSGLPRSTARPYNWKVTQRTTPVYARVFTYSTFRQAMHAADELANYRPISTFGLRGFHTEENK